MNAGGRERERGEKKEKQSHVSLWRSLFEIGNSRGPGLSQNGGKERLTGPASIVAVNDQPANRNAELKRYGPVTTQIVILELSHVCVRMNTVYNTHSRYFKTTLMQ